MKLKLPNVTLLGIDCVDIERLQKALDISSRDIEFGVAKLLTSLPTNDPRKIEIPHINSIENFSEFCIKDLVKYVDTDFVLLVQYDGFILNPQSWIPEFLNYDYIGAPWLVADWSVRDYKFPVELVGTHVVGNGGFSLRSKKFLEISSKLANKGKFKEYHPEDVVLCVWDRKLLETEGIKFSPSEIASQFSIEGTEDEYHKQFGFHGLRWTNIKKWIDENPEYGIVNDLHELNIEKEEYKRRLKRQGFPIVYEWTDEPGTVYEEHSHKGRVAFYVTKGSVTFSGGVEKTVSAGEFIEVPIGVAHTALVSDEGCEYVVGQEIEGDA